MAQFLVDSTQVAQASAHTAAMATRIRGDVAAMMAQLHALQSSWNGQAAATFQQCAQRWQAAQVGVEDALNQISRALAVASHTYQQAEAQAAGLFAG